MAQDMTQDSEGAADQQGDQQQADQGFVIEIRCYSDGTFDVESEPMSQEGEEDGAGNSSGGQYSSIGEAMKQALSIYKDGGESDAEQGGFEEGFGEPQRPSGLTTMPQGGYQE